MWLATSVIKGQCHQSYIPQLTDQLNTQIYLRQYMGVSEGSLIDIFNGRNVVLKVS